MKKSYAEYNLYVSYYDVARTDESLFTNSYPRIDTNKEKTEFAKELLVPGSTAE